MHAQQNKANLKAWWNNIKGRKDPDFEVPYRPHDNADHPVFGKTLKESLKYASVQISTADANGNLYVWGYIPVVVAKCGLYLKENATEVPGTFRISGSNRRMRELQAGFETPPRYGKSLDWRKESYTTHDVASVFRRYLTQMPEPVIPHDMYHLFRDALAKRPFNQEEAIATYKSLIRKLPKPNQYLLLYVLDLLSVFARKNDLNLMTATNLAVIFRPGLISHPSHEQSPSEHNLSQRVLEFLIAQQDWFMLDISPPSAAELADELTYGTGGRSGVKFDHRTDTTNGSRPLITSPEYYRNGRWPESTNMPNRNPAWKSSSGTSAVAWNHDPDTAPSTPRPRPRIGSLPSTHSSSLPTLLPETRTLGQLTEQITPNSSVPPSPTSLHFDRTRPNAALPQSNGNKIDLAKAHQRRPSSPLNVSYLPNQVHRTHSGTPPRVATPSESLTSDVDELMIIPSGASLKSAEEEDPEASFVPGGGGWKIVGRNVGSGMISAVEGWHQAGAYNGGHLGGFMSLGALRREKKDKDREREEKERIKMMRRRTTFDRTGMIPHGAITPIQESPMDSDLPSNNRLSSGGLQRSRTLPSRRKDKLSSEDLVGGAATDKENEKSPTTWSRKENDKEKEQPKRRVLKKNRPNRTSTGLSMASAAGSSPMLTSPMARFPMVSPGVYSGNGPLYVGQEQDPSGGRVSGS